MDYFERSAGVLGENVSIELRSAAFCVFGLGGVGSFVAEALVRTGVGKVSLIDFDTVEYSNINRQLQADTTTVTKSKAEVLGARLLKINPALELHIDDRRLLPGHEASFFPEEPDVVIDAIDDVPAKVALLLYCQKPGYPILTAMGAAKKRHPELLKFSDLLDTAWDPLARRVRQLFRQGGGGRGIEAVYSDEQCKDDGSGIKGSLIWVTGSMGLLLAARSIEKFIKIRFTESCSGVPDA